MKQDRDGIRFMPMQPVTTNHAHCHQLERDGPLALCHFHAIAMERIWKEPYASW
jgi:hypothetical protein